QGGGRGLAREKLAILEDWVQAGLQPDLTLMFDVPTEVARGRVTGMGRELDRFEREQVEFFERVRNAYLARADASQGRIRIIDASRSIDQIKITLEEIIATI
ncbi:MAG: dTMP kinase, partial [Rhodocyclales bacterium]|nr:dTMP kinase [Rhodocyclales bacterium]